MSIRKLIYAGLALIAIGFAACTQNEEIAPTLNEREINAIFTVEGARTRVNTLDEGNSWENNDTIKVRVMTDYDYSDPVALIYDSDEGTWSHKSPFRWLSLSDKNTIYVSYPYPNDYEDFELPEDQSTLEGLKSADYINGKWEDYPTLSRPINISLNHRMAMITVDCEIGTADFGEDATLEAPQIQALNSGADFSFRDGTMTVLSGNKSVKAYKHNNKFSAIIVPGKYESTDDFISFTLDGKKYVSRLKIRTEFEEGNLYTFHLEVGKNKVELTQINVDDLTGWTHEEDLNN